MPTPYVIDRLWQGSSGQAPWLRNIGTVQSSRNVRFDIRVGGAVKRNATELLADLDEFTGETFDPTLEYAWAAIRGAHIAISAAGVVHAWDENGDALETIDLTGGNFATYMTLVDDLVKDVDIAISFDTAIVCNREIVPLMVPAWDHQQSLNMIANGDIDDNTDVAGLATIGLEDEANEFSDLPSETSSTGEVWRVLNDENFDPRGFYIHYDPLESGIPDVNLNSALRRHADEWFRIPEKEQRDGSFDYNTMPFRLIYDESLATITIRPCPWLPRLSGNETTNAILPWIASGQSMRSVEFHSGRLFLLGKAHVTASRKDDFFNLFNNDIKAINNQDRIIANITQSGNGNALRCKSGGGGLFITLENGQIEFSSGSVELTNANGRTVTVMDLASTDIKPANAGNAITMIDELGDIHQFNWQVGDRNSNIIYSGLLSAHQWDILDDKTVKRIFSIGTTVYITTDAGAAIVHDSFFVGGNAEQSAWGDFDPTDPPVFFYKWKDKTKVITRRDTTAGGYSLLDYVHREQEPPAGSDLLYMPAMDRMEKVSDAMTYDQDTDLTTAVHTGRDGVLTGIGRSFIVTDQPDTHAFIPAVSLDSNGNPQFNGNLTGDSFNFEQFLGFSYRSELVLTDLYPTLTGRNLVMQRLVVFHLDTSDYEVIYTDAGGVVLISQWQAHVVGVAKTDVPSRDTGFSDHGVRGDPRTLPITIRSDTPGTFAIMGLEYELVGQGRGKT